MAMKVLHNACNMFIHDLNALRHTYQVNPPCPCCNHYVWRMSFVFLAADTRSSLDQLCYQSGPEFSTSHFILCWLYINQIEHLQLLCKLITSGASIMCFSGVLANKTAKAPNCVCGVHNISCTRVQEWAVSRGVMEYQLWPIKGLDVTWNKEQILHTQSAHTE